MMVTSWTGSVVAVAAACVAGAGVAHAQTVAEQVRAAPDGRVRMTFASRPGVCGDGQNISTRRGDNEDWEWDCKPGPVRVVLTKDQGEIVRIRTYVGGRWRAASRTTDLGRVSALDAADYLTDIARRGGERASRDAVFPATMADSAVVWPALLDVARDDTRPRRTRRAALQWVGTAAGDVVVQRLASVEDPDREVRERAVFAVSQLPRDQGIPLLVEVARTHRDPEIRRKALFWLGQSEDPRAVDLFEEVLRSR